MAGQVITIPKKWKTAPIKDVVDIVIDNRGRNPEYYVSKGIPVIDNVLIKGERKIDLDEARRFIDENIYSSFIRKYNQKNDVLITLVGNGYGNVALSPKDKSIIMQNTIGLRCNDLGDNTFLFYNLSLNKRSLTDLNIGAAQPSIKVGDLLNIELNLPPISEQRAIAAVLSSLDDKIELLREQNKTLEATVQAIFKEWFVNFNFPGATGKMVDSELGEIPEGWKVDRLSEIIVFEGGAQPPKSEHIYEPRDGYVRFIQNRDYSNSSHITYIKESKKNKLCEVFDIMMDKYGDVGVPRWGLVGAYNVALAKIVPKIKNSREYLRSYFSQRAVFSLLSASAQASTRGSLNEGTFKGVTLIIPDEITLERFEKLQSKFLSKILFNNAEVETLSQLRDTLLPKLMKGDVRVEGFEN